MLYTLLQYFESFFLHTEYMTNFNVLLTQTHTRALIFYT